MPTQVQLWTQDPAAAPAVATPLKAAAATGKAFGAAHDALSQASLWNETVVASDAPAAAAAAPVAPIDAKEEALRSWLLQAAGADAQAGGRSAGAEAARDYLLRGPPYRGDAYKADLPTELLENNRLRWTPNPEYDATLGAAERERGRGRSRRGWWSAPTACDLRVVLETAAQTTSSASPASTTHRAAKQRRAWTPVGLADADARRVASLLKEH